MAVAYEVPGEPGGVLSRQGRTEGEIRRGNHPCSPSGVFFLPSFFSKRKRGSRRTGGPRGNKKKRFPLVKDFPVLNRIPGESAFESEEKDVRHTRPTLSRQEAERLVETYSDLVLRLSYTYLKSREDAKDICQTVFLKLLEKPRAFDSPEHEKAWIIRTAANACKDMLKSHWHRTRADLQEADGMACPQAEEGSLLAAVELLPPKYRAVIYLYYYEGYTAKEIAQMLGEHPATVSTQLSRGRSQLRTLLEQEGLA